MRNASRRHDWLIGLLIPLGMLVLALDGRVAPLERAAHELAARAAATATGGAPVVLVTLAADNWPRDRLADLHARIAAGEPRAIGHASDLSRPENGTALAVLDGLLREQGERLGATGRALVERARGALATDRALADVLAAGPPSVLGAGFTTGRDVGPDTPEADLPAGLAARSPASGPHPLELLPGGDPPVAATVRLPLASLAAASGHVALGPRLETGAGGDGSAIVLARRHGERWLSSLAFALYLLHRGTAPDEVVVRPGRGVEVGDHVFLTGPPLAVHPRPARPDGESAGPRRIAAAAVLGGEIAPAVFRDRTVLVGPAEVQPAGPATAEAGVAGLAAAAAALIEQRLFATPPWTAWTRLAAFAGVALYLMLVLPRLAFATGLAVSGLLAVALANGQFLLLTLQGVWLPLMAPATALVLGHGILAGKHGVGGVLAGFHADIAAARAELGELLRAEGRLDDAFRRLRGCRADDDVVECMYQLGQDFERRRRFGRAAEAFAWLARRQPGYRDSERRERQNRQRQEQAALGLTASASTAQTLLADGEVQKPMLGRYEIEREIGRGAMGIVYLGRDPRIGRTVAIKTLALDREFEGQSLADIKARFRREAETAGRLKHHNIVTIHDVGEEDDLAWIAMDYLEGTPMTAFADADALLPPADLFGVIAEVADALDHAHREGVVHRDVKPENILYDRARGTATVTDFGVASVSDHSKTRTGTILGTPSYMAPEQVAGQRVDGRCDIFALGVTLYQLLTGALPFTGDSLSNLMYRIANERHREVRRIRQDLPTCATTITNRALAKDPDRRYASAAQMAQALRRCRQKLDDPTQAGGRSRP